MKTRKLLSALLAASVIFSTMTFTVSAARNDISIGSSAYDTLEEAIAAAQDGDTIDLNNSTVEPSGAINNIADKSITITNGVIDLSDVGASGTYLFKITGSSSVVTFSEISFEGDDYNSKNGIIYAGGGAGWCQRVTWLRVSRGCRLAAIRQSCQPWPTGRRSRCGRCAERGRRW